MKTAYFGWEADSLQNSQAQFIVPITTPIVLRGYQFDLAMGSLKAPWIGQANFAMVLFQFVRCDSKPGGWAPATSNADFGQGFLRQVSGTNTPTLHGQPQMTGGAICAAILKTWAPAAVNKRLIMSGLDISLNGWLAMNAGHSGFSQDFEVQGTLYYD
jgi:hypothetical protein